jgi:hypothetical protein
MFFPKAVPKIKDSLMSWLLGSDAVPNGYTVQLHPAQTGGVDYLLGDVTPGQAPPGVFADILTTGVWGSTDPESFINVHDWGVPPAPVQVQGGGAPSVLANNAPKGGSC